MANKDTAISKIDQVNTAFSTSPIVKGLIDGGLSLIPFLGQAITSALDTRAFQLFEQNSKSFAEEVKKLMDKVDESKVDKRFIHSTEFVSLLIDILARNAHTHEEEKINLYAKLFVNFTKHGNSETPYKEGLIRIIDELGVEHIRILAFIKEKDKISTPKDGKSSTTDVQLHEIAQATGIPKSRVQAYCDQMIRFGLLQDAAIGYFGYEPGSYAITEYGYELTRFLTEQVS
ncbi:MAG: MarR family transcriptional regulator [Candidatus Manganitrophus sp. SB1]|nr:MarR family transcriptional regulator [Candidatus Manganitrophus morganii]